MTEERVSEVEAIFDSLKEERLTCVLFKRAFLSSPLASGFVNLEGQFLEVNEALCHVLGYSSDELSGMSVQDVSHPESLTQDQALIDECLSGERLGYRLAKTYLHKLGHEVEALLYMTLVKTDKEKIFLKQIVAVETVRALCKTSNH